MKRNKIIIVIVILSLIWIIGCIYTNIKFPKANIRECNINETIENEGLSFTAIDFIATEGEEDSTLGRSKSYKVELKIKNTSSDVRKIDLIKFRLTRLDYSNGPRLEVFLDINDDVDTRLEPNEEVTLYLPFTVHECSFTKQQWEKIDESNWKLLLNLYPDKVRINLN